MYLQWINALSDLGMKKMGRDGLRQIRIAINALQAWEDAAIIVGLLDGQHEIPGFQSMLMKIWYVHHEVCG